MSFNITQKFVPPLRCIAQPRWYLHSLCPFKWNNHLGIQVVHTLGCNNAEGAEKGKE